MLAPFFEDVDLDAGDLLAPLADPAFEALDFFVVLEADFFALDLDAVDLFAPDFVPLDDFEPADFFAVELPPLVPEDFFVAEDFLVPPVLDLDDDELDFFFAAVPEDLAVPDFEVDLDAELPDFEDDPGFDDVELVFFPDEVPRRGELFVAAAPSETSASPAPCNAPAAAPAAALAITSPAVAAAEVITLPAASFVFCTRPFLLEPFLAAILLFLLDVCAQYTALPHCKGCAET